MTLTDIEATLRDGRPLTRSQAKLLRTSAAAKDNNLASRALQLIHAYPGLCHVSDVDIPWLEIAADRGDDPFIAANALSLLCDWLGRITDEAPRLLRALASRTEGGDFLCITACSLAGQLLSKAPNFVVTQQLYSILRDPNRATGTREAARDAFLVASGMSPRDIVLAEKNGTTNLWKRANDAATMLLAVPPQ